MSREGNSKVTGKGKFEMEDGRDQHLFAKLVQIIQTVPTYQGSDLQQSDKKNGEKPVFSPAWLWKLHR